MNLCVLLWCYLVLKIIILVKTDMLLWLEEMIDVFETVNADIYVLICLRRTDPPKLWHCSFSCCTSSA